jgi:hypothetical protein
LIINDLRESASKVQVNGGGFSFLAQRLILRAAQWLRELNAVGGAVLCPSYPARFGKIFTRSPGAPPHQNLGQSLVRYGRWAQVAFTDQPAVGAGHQPGSQTQHAQSRIG